MFINRLKRLLDIRFTLISLILTATIYLFYSQILSWGGYAGYILQAQNAFGSKFYDFVEIQKVLYSFTEFQRDPIYTPIGLPILINILSIFHNWNPLLIKLIVPISVFLLIIYSNKITKNSEYKFVYLLLPLNPGVVDEYRDTQTELPGVIFFLFGIYAENKIFKITLFIIATLIRPPLVIAIFIYYIFVFFEEKKYLGGLSYFFAICSIYLILSEFFNIKFYGDYSNRGTKSSSLMQLYEHLITLDFVRFKFIFSELGRLFVGFTNSFNYYIGLIILVLLIIFRNKYSLMGLSYILFHFAWDAPYFVRYLLPVLIFFSLGCVEFVNKKKINAKVFKLIVLFIFLIYAFQIGYQVSNLDTQRGPYQEDSIELFEYVNGSEYELFSFHSPRVFRIFTEKSAYRLDTNLITDTVIICEYINDKCLIPEDYISEFKNNSFEVFVNNK